MVVQERLDGKLVVCYQNQIVPTQEAPPRPGVLRTLNATEVLAASPWRTSLQAWTPTGSVVTSEKDWER